MAVEASNSEGRGGGGPEERTNRLDSCRDIVTAEAEVSPPANTVLNPERLLIPRME